MSRYRSHHHVGLLVLQHRLPLVNLVELGHTLSLKQLKSNPAKHEGKQFLSHPCGRPVGSQIGNIFGGIILLSHVENFNGSHFRLSCSLQALYQYPMLPEYSVTYPLRTIFNEQTSLFLRILKSLSNLIGKKFNNKAKNKSGIIFTQKSHFSYKN